MSEATSAGPLDRTFTAVLLQSEAKGGWTYLKLDGSAEYFGTRGLVKVTGTHKLPVAAELRRKINKQAGDTVTVHLLSRLS